MAEQESRVGKYVVARAAGEEPLARFLAENAGEGKGVDPVVGRGRVPVPEEAGDRIEKQDVEVTLPAEAGRNE